MGWQGADKGKAAMSVPPNTLLTSGRGCGFVVVLPDPVQGYLLGCCQGWGCEGYSPELQRVGLKRGCQREGGLAKRNLSQELLLVAVGFGLRLSWGPNVKAFLHRQHYSGSKAVMPVKIFFFSFCRRCWISAVARWLCN